MTLKAYCVCVCVCVCLCVCVCVCVYVCVHAHMCIITNVHAYMLAYICMCEMPEYFHKAGKRHRSTKGTFLLVSVISIRVLN